LYERGAILAKNTVSLVWDIAEPLAEELGLILWDVVFEKEGANYYLKIFIDKEDGVGIEDCVNMSHALDKPLDEKDPVDRQYNLQVSSPGIERKLTRDFHFDYAMEEKVILKLIRPFDGKREFKGVLVDYSDKGDVTIAIDEENTMTATKQEIAWVKLDDFNA
jgi:ribosome maturation factor RimP